MKHLSLGSRQTDLAFEKKVQKQYTLSWWWRPTEKYHLLIMMDYFKWNWCTIFTSYEIILGKSSDFLCLAQAGEIDVFLYKWETPKLISNKSHQKNLSLVGLRTIDYGQP